MYILQVFDKDTLLETLCQYIPQTRLTARDDMTIIFHSDDTINLSGFTAEYSVLRLEGRFEPKDVSYRKQQRVE